MGTWVLQHSGGIKYDQVPRWEWGAGLFVIIVLALAGAFLLASFVAGPMR